MGHTSEKEGSTPCCVLHTTLFYPTRGRQKVTNYERITQPFFFLKKYIIIIKRKIRMTLDILVYAYSKKCLKLGNRNWQQISGKCNSFTLWIPFHLILTVPLPPSSLVVATDLTPQVKKGWPCLPFVTDLHCLSLSQEGMQAESASKCQQFAGKNSIKRLLWSQFVRIFQR